FIKLHLRFLSPFRVFRVFRGNNFRFQVSAFTPQRLRFAFTSRTFTKQTRHDSHFAAARATSRTRLRFALRNIQKTARITHRSPAGTTAHHSGSPAPFFLLHSPFSILIRPTFHFRT